MTDTIPTPITDAAVVHREYILREMDIYSHKFVLADFARTLERELAAIKSQPVPVEPEMTRADDFLPTTYVVRRTDYDSLQQQLQVVQQELKTARHTGGGEKVVEAYKERAEKAEERNKRLVELVERAKTEFQAYLNGPCTFTKSRTSTDCGCVSCTTRNAMTDLLREVGK